MGIGSQYSFSRFERPPETDYLAAVLALDTGSPLVSVAVALKGEVVAEEAVDLEHSSGRLLSVIDRVLHAAGIRSRDLEALVGLRGPGSFTGLRVGLATLQGMQQALRIRAGTLSTFEVLASLAIPAGSPVLACVDALRGQWLVQGFLSGTPPTPSDEVRLCSAEDILAAPGSEIIGFGCSGLNRESADARNLVVIEPGPLAGQALRLLPAGLVDWQADCLTRPLYLRPPAVSIPGRPQRT